MTSDRERAVAEAERRRRMAAVFGEPLPERTREECDDDRSGDRGAEDWLRGQVPPHHG